MSADEDELRKDVVYGVWPPPGWMDGPKSIRIVERSEAIKQANILKALESPTWGDVKRTATPANYVEILDHAGYRDTIERFDWDQKVANADPLVVLDDLRRYAQTQGDPLPADNDPLRADDVLGYNDGTFPMIPEMEMIHLLPDAVLALGKIVMVPEGEYSDIGLEQMDEVVDKLTQAGFTCVQDQGMIDALFRQ